MREPRPNPAPGTPDIEKWIDQPSGHRVGGAPARPTGLGKLGTRALYGFSDPIEQAGKAAFFHALRYVVRVCRFSGHHSGNSFPVDRKSTRLNSSHIPLSRMPSSA